MITTIHKSFLNKISDSLKSNPKIAGLAVGGSFINNDMDEYSDLDLVIAIYPEHYEDIMNSRMEIANNLGNLLSAFTGDHVGEPRLIIALYKEDDNLIHVDYKFVSTAEIAKRVDDPIILWERDKCITNEFVNTHASFPSPSMQWIEDRFWVWVHYATIKIARGELFETIEFISFLRQTVIGPLLQIKNGNLPKGVRKIEITAPNEIAILKETIAVHDRKSCISALETIIHLYIELRRELFDSSTILRFSAEKDTLMYLDKIKGDFY